MLNPVLICAVWVTLGVDVLKLILYSDQGTQYTSKAFIDFCESAHVTQSMSKAAYLYDNAPMEKYFNT